LLMNLYFKVVLINMCSNILDGWISVIIQLQVPKVT
jgi:hypothetical protein